MTLNYFFRNLFCRAVDYEKSARLPPLACSKPICYTDPLACLPLILFVDERAKTQTGCPSLSSE
jgi:hypothetical protein